MLHEHYILYYGLVLAFMLSYHLQTKCSVVLVWEQNIK